MFIKRILTFVGLGFASLVGCSILITMKILSAEVAAILWVACLLVFIGVAITMKPKAKKPKDE